MALNKKYTTEPIRKTLKKGDKVMVIAGGNKQKRANKGQVGTIIKFVGKKKDRAVVEGLNMVAKHKRATQPGESGGKVVVPAPIHISNLMFYVEKEKRPVRLKKQTLEDGRKVRGYMSKESNEFIQV